MIKLDIRNMIHNFFVVSTLAGASTYSTAGAMNAYRDTRVNDPQTNQAYLFDSDPLSQTPDAPHDSDQPDHQMFPILI